MLIWGKRLLYLLLTIFIFYNVFLSTALVRTGEVQISNDVGRDFLLLNELSQKKIVLIGARSNVQGVFHGPLWTYMNYPAYLIGGGNPVTIAWSWVVMSVIALIVNFIIIKKIFGSFTAILATSMFSVVMVSLLDQMFGPLAMFFFMPSFILSLYVYLKTKKWVFLSIHFMLLAFLVHLNIGAGLLFVILSGLITFVFILRKRLWFHFLALLTLPLFCLNFIIFDIRHNFLISKAILNLSGSSKFLIPLNEWIFQRVNLVISMQILSSNIPFLSTIIFILVIIFTLVSIKGKCKHSLFLVLLMYFYFGYILLTYFNKGTLIVDQVFLLIPIVILWLAVFARGKYKVIFVPVIILILLLNFEYAKSFVNYSLTRVGKNPDSWVAMKTVANKIVNSEKGKEFGYFVYSPDVYAYQQRYVMTYVFKNSGAKPYEYVKMPTTIIIVSPKPVDKPYMGEDWWIKNEAKINIKPAKIDEFVSGYKIEKFLLSPEEQKIPFDRNIKIGLTFR